MSPLPEPPHPARDPSGSLSADDPWQETTLWGQPPADPRLPAVTWTFIDSALAHFKVGDPAMAEKTLYPVAHLD